MTFSFLDMGFYGTTAGLQTTFESSSTSSMESLSTWSDLFSASGRYPTSTPDMTTEEMPHNAGATTSDPQGLLLKHWDAGFKSQWSVVTSRKKVARDGSSFLSLYGSISQIFNTTEGSHYQVVIFASHVVPSRNPLLNQEGRVEAPGLNRVFRLYDRPAHGHSDQSLRSIQWHQYRFYFTANNDVSTLKISSVGRSNGILLDNIQVCNSH